jgi:hypothetical protein
VFTSQNITILLISLLAISFTGLQSAIAQNGTSSTVETFNDTGLGVSFQYPSDWVIASEEYTDQVLSSEDDASNMASPIQLLHESLDGANLLIVPEILPFPISLEKYFELNKQQIATDPSIQMSNAVTPVSVGGVDGLKYDLLVDDGVSKYNQTQIALVKDANAYVLGYMLGSSNPETQLADINSIIDSMRFQ